METWIISDNMGEYVEYYNPTGHVMVFTQERERAWKVTDSQYAFDVAKIAQKVYQRRNMRIGMA